MGSLMQNIRTLLKFLGVLGVLVLLNVIVTQNDIQWDMTESRIYSLQQQSIKVARNIENPVNIMFFHTKQAASSQVEGSRVRRLLKQYTNYNAQIKFSEYDHTRNPDMARQYNVSENNAVVIEVQGRTKTISPFDMIEFGGRMRRQQSFRGEKAVTEALMKLTQTTERIVYFTKGHGEYSRQSGQGPGPRPRQRGSQNSTISAWSGGLQEEGYSVDSLNLLTEELPDTSNLIVIVQPTQSISDRIAKRIRKWSEQGGNLIVAAGPAAAQNVRSTLLHTSIRIQRKQIIDPQRRVQTLQSLVNPFLFAPRLENHPAVADVKEQGIGIQLNRTAPISFNNTAGDTPSKIMTTSAEAYSKPLSTNQERLETSFNSETDERGPFPVAASLSLTADAGKVVAIGNAGALTDRLLRQAPGNRNFALNLVSWIFDRDVSVGIRSTPSDYNKVQVTANQSYVLQIIALLVLPGFIILWGGWVWWKRKNL